MGYSYLDNPGGGHITDQLNLRAMVAAASLICTACSHQPAPVIDRTGGVGGTRDSLSLGQSKGYVVRRGDTLYSIAFDAGLDFRSVASWNQIGPPYRIYPGQRLRLDPNTGRGTQARQKSQNLPPRRSSPPPQQAVKAWSWPTQGQIIQRFSPNQRRTGIDIAGAPGQEVRTAAPGRIVYAGSGLRGYGKLIIVKHNEVFLSAYAHNRKILVKEDVWVAAGQRIAEMGSTGTNRIKLHFEIRRDGRPVDPLRYLPKR